MIKLLVVLFSFVVTLPIYGKSFKVGDPKRAIAVIGMVDDSIIPLAAAIDKMSRESSDPIYLLINSPGGSVYAGMTFVDAMKAAKERGVQFYCASQVMAASMAFTFLNECQNRYATFNTRLLFHPVSVSTKGSRVHELIVDLESTMKEEKKFMRELKESMGLSWETFNKNYYAETFWAAGILAEETRRRGWITIVDTIDGFGDLLYTYKKPMPLLFFKSKNEGSVNGIAEQILERFEKGVK